MKQYILVGHTPFEATDIREWAQWFEHFPDDRIVAQTTIGSHVISTAFMGLDLDIRATSEIPLLFETAVFDTGSGSRSMVFASRTRSWDEAEARHREIVETMLASKK